MAKILIRLTDYGGRKFIPKATIKELYEKYGIIRLKIDGQEIGVNIRKDGRGQIAKRFSEKFNLKKGMNKFNILPVSMIDKKYRTQKIYKHWDIDQHDGIHYEKYFNVVVAQRQGNTIVVADKKELRRLTDEMADWIKKEWSDNYGEEKFPYAYASIWGYFDKRTKDNTWDKFTKAVSNEKYGYKKLIKGIRRIMMALEDIDNPKSMAIYDISGYFDFKENFTNVILWKIRLTFRNITA